MSDVQAVPDGFHTVTPHLWIRGAADAVEWYKKAFGAEELVCMRGPDGDKVMHAMIKIGSSLIMLADAWPGQHEVAPAEVGHSTVGMWLYVDDVDTLYKRAVDAGAEVIDELMDAFWGDRMGKVKDPFGHAWALASHVEDVPPAEMERRQEEWFASMGDDE